MNTWLIKGAAALAVAATFIGTGWKLGVDHVTAKQARDKDLINQAADAFDGRVATHVGNMSVRHQTIVQPAKETIREEIQYRDCVQSTDVERLLDAARANRGPGER